MFPSVVIFVHLFSAAVDVLVHSQCCIAKKKAVQTSSDIAIANSVSTRSSTFKRTMIGDSFCCFTPGSSFAYPLKVCSNRNDNDPYGYLLGLSLKAALKDWDSYPKVSMTVAATSILFSPCKNLACLTACAKSTKMIYLCQRMNLSRKTPLIRPIDRRNLHHLS